MRRLPILLLLVCACSKPAPATTNPSDTTATTDDALAGKPVVRNVDAVTGDVTLCPYSGRKFVVADDSPRWEYQGKTWVFCAQKALDEVQKDPAKYLDGFEG
jgi:hypothetical protein